MEGLQVEAMVKAYADAAGWPQSTECTGVFGRCWQKRGIKKKASQNYPKAYCTGSAGAIVSLDSIARVYYDPVNDWVWFHFEGGVPNDPLIERLMSSDQFWSDDDILEAWRDAEAAYRRNWMFHSAHEKTPRMGPREAR